MLFLAVCSCTKLIKLFILRTNKIQSKMSNHSIPQMNKKLQQLNAFFTKQSTQFCVQISRHPGKITTKDQKEFIELIQRIKNYAITEINQFFQSKIQSKCQIYNSQITNYSQSGDETEANLKEFRQDLQESTTELKLTQNRKQNLLEHFSLKYSRNATLKRYWAILKKNRDQSIRQKQLYDQMKRLYIKNLLKKSFFPWRRLTYKQGYENTVKRQTQKDTMSIHQQYQTIINILKTKIAETDEIVKIKKAAKGEFAYALNKNLLKTISNLSLEVMSLNQMSLRDGQTSEQETKQFMTKVDTIITEKLIKVSEYKNTLTNDDKTEDKKKKKIKFVE